ncbi:unnamed protein product, partial [Ranitomeya imitator]
ALSVHLLSPRSAGSGGHLSGVLTTDAVSPRFRLRSQAPTPCASWRRPLERCGCCSHSCVPIVQYDVYSQEPQLKVEPLSGEFDGSGSKPVPEQRSHHSPLSHRLPSCWSPQKLKFTVTTGHYQVKRGDALQLSNATLCPSPQDWAPPPPSTRTATSSDKVTSISLPLAPPYHVMEFELDVVCLLPEAGHLMNGEVPRKGKDPHNSPSSGILEQRVSVDCPWSILSHDHQPNVPSSSESSAHAAVIRHQTGVTLGQQTAITCAGGAYLSYPPLHNVMKKHTQGYRPLSLQQGLILGSTSKSVWKNTCDFLNFQLSDSCLAALETTLPPLHNGREGPPPVASGSCFI